MDTRKKFESLAEFVLGQAKKHGATACDVALTATDGASTSARMRDPQGLEGGENVGSAKIRVFVGRKCFQIEESVQLTRRVLERHVKHAMQVVVHLPDNPFASLPDPAAQAKEVLDLDLFDPAILQLSGEAKVDLARRAEEAALSFSPEIKSSYGGDCSTEYRTAVYATSDGFLGGLSAAAISVSAGVVAERDGRMNNGARGCLVRRLSEMESPEEIGKEAGRRAVRGLGARTVPYQEVPVVYSPSMAVGLLGKVVDALNGQSIFSGQSFLVDKLGTQIANKNLTLVDDPFIKGGLGSAPFGEEGLALQRRVLINEGRLETYFLNAEAGRKLKMVANGGSSTNLIVQAGTLTADAIIASVQSGLYLTSVSGMGADTATGRYSLGAGGIWIENGKLSFAVEGLTISSTLQDMLAGIDAVGNDLDFKRGARVAPTILIRKMKVGASK